MTCRKYYNLVASNPLMLCTLFFVCAFAFVRIPYFVVYNIPAYLPGVTDYILFAMQIKDGDMASYGLLPIGYPVILAALMKLFFTIKPVIFLQVLAALTSGIAFIWVLSATYKRYLFAGTLAITFYLTTSLAISEDHSYDLESFYRSFLILAVAVFIYISRFYNSGKAYLLLGIITFSVALFRTNGPFIYILYFFVSLLLVWNKVPAKTWIYFLVPFFILNVSWAAMNYKLTGIFFIGDTKRLVNRYNGKLDEKMVSKSRTKDFYFTELEQKHYYNKPMLKLSQAYLYLTNVGKRRGLYYSLIIPEQMTSLLKCEVQDMKTTASIFLVYDTAYHHDKAYARYLSNELAGYCYQPGISMIQFLGIARQRYKELYITPVISVVTRLSDLYHTFQKLINNFLTAILALFSIVFLFVRFYSAERKLAYFFLSVFLIHLISIGIIVVLQARFLWRYGFATDFVLYFLLSVGLTELYFSVKSKLSN